MLAIDEALTRLAANDERLARIVELKFFGGLTHEEIAGALDTSSGAARMAVLNARRKLRERLGEVL